uniref:Transposase n=1 Tax=Steinernema glaseri TaxID=37863 RepID=A0A1I7Z6S9_9BILA
MLRFYSYFSQDFRGRAFTASEKFYSLLLSHYLLMAQLLKYVMKNLRLVLTEARSAGILGYVAWLIRSGDVSDQSTVMQKNNRTPQKTNRDIAVATKAIRCETIGKYLKSSSRQTSEFRAFSRASF